jgi:L-glutamine-phosphate cytidylyltransferase
MRAIIIGAGRGARLMPTTQNAPKCFAEIRGKRILDWTLESLRAGGVTDFCFIGGYRMELVRECYPHFTFRHNSDWQNNNILASLMHAEDLMDRPFLTSYSDILYTPDIVAKMVAEPADIALAVQPDWTRQYELRTMHPPDDAEKVRVADGRIERVHRDIPYDDAHGEFIGLAKFSVEGAARLRTHYHAARARHAGRPFREAAVFEKAYLIHLLQDMVEAGQAIQAVMSPGQYREIDTQEDMDLAQTRWIPAT